MEYSFLCFMFGHQKCDGIRSRWELIYCCKKGLKHWHKSYIGKRRLKPNEPRNALLGIKLLMDKEGIECPTFPEDMDIGCYSIYYPSMTKYGIGDNNILAFNSDGLIVNIDYTLMANVLTRLLSCDHSNLCNLSTILMTEIRNKNTYITINERPELDRETLTTFMINLSNFCTRFSSYRLAYISIAFILFLREYLGDDQDENISMTYDYRYNALK